VIDHELRASSKEISERRFSFIGLEAIFLFDPNPRQLLPSPRQLVTAARQFFLGLEQIEPGGKPFLSQYDLAVFGPVNGFNFGHNMLLRFIVAGLLDFQAELAISQASTWPGHFEPGR
jgi:hypothetical protein